jgi:protein-tyrosine phosphatase
MTQVIKPSVLIVCMANQCRSPMGEGILKHLVEKRSDCDQWRIESAGVWADSGFTATRNAKAVMAQKGIDISSHRSKPVVEELLRQFNLVLTMEKKHKEMIQSAFPQFSTRVFMVSEMIGKLEDVSDPIIGGLDYYQETAEKLEHIFSDGLERIYRLATVAQDDGE